MDNFKTYSRCKICLTEDCKKDNNGECKKCNCSTCQHISECNKNLHATIRITNKCTQKCSHCCFCSSPKSEIMMSVEQAKKTAEFLDNNNVFTVNVMGGEFFCNQNWFEIIQEFLKVVLRLRLVTNGDWSHNEDVKNKLKYIVENYNNIHFSISKDQWHTNKNIDEAESYLKEIGAEYNVATAEETTEASIVPVGRGVLAAYNVYSSFGNYCQQPKEMYSFLIDEVGHIFKCSFGTWCYATVDEYFDGGFEKRFKEYNKKFRSIFIPNCARCRMSAERYEQTDDERPLVVCTD